jgi:hypothetical protein
MSASPESLSFTSETDAVWVGSDCDVPEVSVSLGAVDRVDVFRSGDWPDGEMSGAASDPVSMSLSVDDPRAEPPDDIPADEPLSPFVDAAELDPDPVSLSLSVDDPRAEPPDDIPADAPLPPRVDDAESDPADPVPPFLSLDDPLAEPPDDVPPDEPLPPPVDEDELDPDDPVPSA